MKARVYARAMLYHIKWKVQLRKFLDGKGRVTEAEYISPDDCKFGRWLCSEEIMKYAADSEIREIRKVHTELHKAAERAYELKLAGDDRAAFREFKNMEAGSMKLLSLLNTMKSVGKN
ncbi:MAG TPA: CZB domain-containing protein [Thermodesulfovibrionales bacterium]|nr:CZB domain-containing protein [Thermodesulfovibrionales bacterium]